MAFHHFLFDKDLHGDRPALFGSLVNSKRTIRNKVMGAMQMAESKLSARYIMSEVFISLDEWDTDEAYLTGAYIYKDEVVYCALRNNTGQKPSSSPDDWTEDDPRNQQMVACITALTLWLLFKAVAPDRRPEHIDADFEIWNDWLTDVRNGKENPNLPLKEDGTEIVRHGSQPQREHIY